MIILYSVILVFLLTAAYAAIIGAPTVPFRGGHISLALDKAGAGSGKKLYELGTGFGDISLMANKKGCIICGYEISLLFFIIGFFRLKISNKKNEIKFKNFFKDDLSGADIVYCFLMPETNKKLAVKLRSELKPGSKIISYAFPMEGFDLIEKIKEPSKPSIFVYEV